MLSVAVALWMEGDVVRTARIVLGSIASLPSSADEVAAALVGQPLSDETIRAAAAKTRSAATPMDNTDLEARVAQEDGQVAVAHAALREVRGDDVRELRQRIARQTLSRRARLDEQPCLT